MLIRDDREFGHSKLPQMGDWRIRLFAARADYPHPHYNPDRVLHDCPDCGRAHFVTVDGCPGAAEAAAEVAMAERKVG